MLDDRAVNGSTQVRMLIGDNTSFVTNTIIYILMRCVNEIGDIHLNSIPANLLLPEIGFLSEKVLE